MLYFITCPWCLTVTDVVTGNNVYSYTTFRSPLNVIILNATKMNIQIVFLNVEFEELALLIPEMDVLCKNAFHVFHSTANAFFTLVVWYGIIHRRFSSTFNVLFEISSWFPWHKFFYGVLLDVSVALSW